MKLHWKNNKFYKRHIVLAAIGFLAIVAMFATLFTENSIYLNVMITIFLVYALGLLLYEIRPL